MAQGKQLTELSVKNAKPGMHPDTAATGLALKVTGLRKIWVMKLVWPGGTNQTRRTLGRYPAMSLDDARTLARQWYELAKAGTDPKQLQADKRHAAKVAALNTFEAVAESFIASRTNRRAHKDALAIRRYLVKPWADRPVASITPRCVRLLIGDIGKRTVAGATEAWGHAALIFKYAVHEELISVSPCASLDKKLVIGGKRDPRKRVLDDGEIAKLWQASHRLEYPEGHLYRWLLLSGARLSEASGARWSEFDFERNTWSVPPERFKANDTHVLPLTDHMLALLASIPRNGPWVFSHDGAVAMNGFSKLKEKIDALMGDGVPPFVNHDLRRTVRTNLAALNIADHVAEATVGHGRKGIQRVYDQWRYLPQIREALTAWHARLAAIVGGTPEPQPADNVVPLRRAR